LPSAAAISAARDLLLLDFTQKSCTNPTPPLG
jgi:hypothetical protein